MRKIKTTASRANASLFTFPSRTKLKANTHPGIVVLLVRAKKKDLHYEFQCIFSDTGFKQINKHKPPVTAYVLIMKGAQMRKE